MVPERLERSRDAIRATGAAWVTEHELERLCNEADERDCLRAVLRDIQNMFGCCGDCDMTAKFMIERVLHP